ncbi:TetR/AcrR family transcriptional regulator [Oceanobacillus jeddahense]|uniref:TetR/AcrR family transcriptional regulator n=1 Tax=Oceanobacillus jeddahense TaxID=1462527 RepID=A0ABY5JYA5_9BACI|nr:TetR/AcrR family transcriptional regulator [Oceanobacillus jeddahense]UUI04422.1 TetR/AcrR family transcriptional regulator [Oceanobacillus jeddahense]
MAKKYDAKATIDNILSVAAKLFLEKGFEKTSMRDIAETAGISKGAIYHHFQSKDEIINAVTEKQAEINTTLMQNWLSEMGSLTGKEKLTAILEKNLESQEAHNLDSVMSTRIKSAEFILAYMQDCVNKDAVFISEIIKEGIVDGSLTTDYPAESAETFLLLINVWCDPAVFQGNAEKLSMRLKFLQYMMKSIGIDVLSDTLLQKYLDLLQKLYPEEG